MSTIGVTRHCENIYNLIKEEESVEEEIFKHVSKYHRKIQDEIKKKPLGQKTMGYANVPLKGPKDFLKKNSHTLPQKVIIEKPKRTKEKYTSVFQSLRKNKTEEVKEKVKVKDFENENIINVKIMKPPQRRRRYVDTVHGDVHDLDVSGLVPHYRLNENYGKSPKYLQKMRAKADENVQPETTKPEDKGNYHYVTESERKEILQGMKQNWEELQRQFQALPMMIDTVPKINHKIKLEKELKKLEQDIRIIEDHPYIYIIDNL